jgi:LysM repeat protein
VVATASPVPTIPPTARPTPRPTPTPTDTPLEPSPTPAVTAGPTPSPSPTPAKTPRTYRVRSGDTLSAIAARFGTTVRAIVELNDLADPNALSIGQILLIP